MKKPLLTLVTALTLCLNQACVQTHFEDPIAVMDATAADPDKRANAAKQAEAQSPHDPRRIAALNKVLWNRGYTREEQVYAANQLIQYDEANFRINIRKWGNLLGHYSVIEPIFKAAGDKNWTDFTPTAVRFYARPVHGMAEKDRPENALIAKLNPGKTVEEVIIDVFADPKDQATPEERTAAWALLNRITPRDRVEQLLAQAPSNTPLVADLQACLADLKTFPRDKEGVIWLMSLRADKNTSWWHAAKSAVARLNAEQSKNLELRHLPILILLDKNTLASDRATLLREVSATLANSEHFFSSPTYDGQSKDSPQSLREAADKLTWADLATLRVLLNSVREPRVTQALFAQAEADLKDKTTEHGGALLSTPSGIEARAFEPLMRKHDLKFIASQAMFEAIYTGLAHYHFHAQEHNNRDFAGPGSGDLTFANTQHMNCLVFTYVGKGRLNIDYYQSGGVVVDLGTLTSGNP